MDKYQREMINELSACTFLPGSYQKRFVRDLSTKPDDYELSEKQTAFLEKLHYMYRKQIGKHRGRGYGYERTLFEEAT